MINGNNKMTDWNGILTYNHLIRKGTLSHLAKTVDCF